jgi:Peptidase A4 family
MRAHLWSSVVIAVAGLFLAPAAFANVTNSSNWAGYAVHRSGVSFRQVSATWTQPTAACIAGQPTYSAAWVGLGGYSQNSDALEQAGTELDCSPSGQVLSTAWYELVPAPSKTVSLPVSPGDVMHATVTVVGHRATIDLENLTQHRTFRRTLNTPSIDVSSAEWIVEAPSSECVSQFDCLTLPLADFGSVTFDSASVVSTRGVAGSILSGSWGRTRINLTPGGPHFIVYYRPRGVAGEATTSPLRSGGTEFDVTYSSVAVGQSFLARASSVRAGDLRH